MNVQLEQLYYKILLIHLQTKLLIYQTIHYQAHLSIQYDLSDDDFVSLTGTETLTNKTLTTTIIGEIDYSSGNIVLDSQGDITLDVNWF